MLYTVHSHHIGAWSSRLVYFAIRRRSSYVTPRDTARQSSLRFSESFGIAKLSLILNCFETESDVDDVKDRKTDK
jgi:hypothetical protein